MGPKVNLLLLLMPFRIHLNLEVGTGVHIETEQCFKRTSFLSGVCSKFFCRREQGGNLSFRFISEQ